MCRVNTRRAITIVIVGIVLGILGVLTARFWPWLPAAASSRAVEVDQLFRVMLGFAGFIFFLVEGLLIYAVIRFRRKAGDDSEGPPIHGNNTLEIVWTIIPALIVTYLGVYSYQVLQSVELVPADARVIEVTGQQFQWTYYYPEEDLETRELHLPVNETVLFKIEAVDVIHSFWVPEWRAKQDATPGIVSDFLIRPTEIGTFTAVCAELCGAGHAGMRGTIVVESQADFDQWLAEQESEAAESATASQ